MIKCVILWIVEFLYATIDCTNVYFSCKSLDWWPNIRFYHSFWLHLLFSRRILLVLNSTFSDTSALLIDVSSFFQTEKNDKTSLIWKFYFTWTTEIILSTHTHNALHSNDTFRRFTKRLPHYDGFLMCTRFPWNFGIPRINFVGKKCSTFFHVIFYFRFPQ